MVKMPTSCFYTHTKSMIYALNRPCFLWDIDTMDWDSPRSVEKDISAVLDHVKGGEIVLMHDTYKETVEASKTIIPELISRGFELVTVHTLAEARGVSLENGRSYFGFTDSDIAKLAEQ